MYLLAMVYTCLRKKVGPDEKGIETLLRWGQRDSLA